MTGSKEEREGQHAKNPAATAHRTVASAAFAKDGVNLIKDENVDRALTSQALKGSARRLKIALKLLLALAEILLLPPQEAPDHHRACGTGQPSRAAPAIPAGPNEDGPCTMMLGVLMSVMCSVPKSLATVLVGGTRAQGSGAHAGPPAGGAPCLTWQ